MRKGTPRTIATEDPCAFVATKKQLTKKGGDTRTLGCWGIPTSVQSKVGSGLANVDDREGMPLECRAGSFGAPKSTGLSALQDDA